MVFEKLEERVILNGTLTLLTPLHIGSPKTEFDIEKVDMPILKDTQGQPYIPGSSLKGKVRSEAERIARKEGETVCTPPDTKNMCGTEAPNNLCICCRIFGTAGNTISVASKVRFRDAYPKTRVGETMTRVGIAMDRATGTVAKKALYSIEAIPAGTNFGFEMVTENLAQEEWKLLKAAMGSFIDAGLGGSVSRGMGKVNLVLESASIKTSKSYLGKEKEQSLSGEEFKKWWSRK
ncbi:CRISPR-associated RAMP protein [Candidatus Bathyarchaeota archaeon]|nr:CRISPR-associated RAMP protein [Candidatus Bathyarchaeota archaeon]